MTTAPATPPAPTTWAGPLRRSWMRGLTDREIADRHGMDIRSVRAWRHRSGLMPNMPRPRRKRALSPSQAAAFQAANAARTGAAAPRTVAAATAILDAADDEMVVLSSKYRAVLEARVADPWASLAELAATVGLSKDACAACLRRALIVHAPGVTRP